ncbi:BatA and WFA domain-containing protein [Prosthecobacter sp.]|uniref:vWA domain-containing protein n=1 Tax=Prosthecobacter sp. TaxID=1965333 RepID=UPI001DA299DC|nr:BatA and WFA domain-containing protein [Prosthecobacter sp.]MCB1276504.1 BatA and WFA domain-containing protein [Prosthecobacter sp.]
MRLLNPSYLHLAWLALIPLALWLFRRQAKRVPVSTLLFFKSLAREHQESAWLRRIKKWFSLLLTLLVLLFAILALTRPSGNIAANSIGAVVVVVDCSASMAAKDLQGQTRLDEARQLLKERLRSLPDQVVLSLISFDARPSVLLSRSRNRRECLRLIDELSPTPVEGKPDNALNVAQRLADLESHSRIWMATDSKPVADASVDLIPVALSEPLNVGITGFQIRHSPLARDRYEAFVKVSAAAGNPAKTTSTLEISIAGRIAQLREIDLSPGESSVLILPLEGVRGQGLEMRLKTAGDCFGWDDGLAAPLPKTKPLTVAWFAQKPDPFTELALSSLIEAGRIEMRKGDPAAWPPKEQPDVYVFEHWLPKNLPTDRPVIALTPLTSSGPLRTRTINSLPHDSVRSVQPDHPVLFRASSSRIAVTQTTLLDLPSSIEPLWIAGNEPVLAAGEFNGRRLVVTAFSPAQSEQLALLPSFPLILGNALYWCAENSDALADVRTLHTGDMLHTDSLVQWRAWNGDGFVDVSDDPSHGLLALNRIGRWETGENRSGACALISDAETNLPVRPADTVDAIQPAVPIITASAFSTWPQRLIWLALGLLLLESFLFHRKAVY